MVRQAGSPRSVRGRDATLLRQHILTIFADVILPRCDQCLSARLIVHQTKSSVGHILHRVASLKDWPPIDAVKPVG